MHGYMGIPRVDYPRLDQIFTLFILYLTLDPPFSDIIVTFSLELAIQGFEEIEFSDPDKVWLQILETN